MALPIVQVPLWSIIAPQIGLEMLILGNPFLDIISLGLGIFSWISKKQPIVALSSTKAKYKEACFAAYEVVRLKRILLHMGV